MTDIDRRLLIGLAGVAGATLATKLAQGGSLNPPPGPVTPTGKTTDQIEPRIDLLNAPASANVTNDANNHCIINNPGSYYLSGNLAVTKANGISVQAAGVTIDLCGFQIYRASGSGGHAAAGALVIGNGSARGFAVGFSVPPGGSCRLHDLSTVQCGTGFDVSDSSVMTSCTANNCTQLGFSCVDSCTLVDCAALACAESFSVGDGCTLARCTADFSSGAAFAGKSGCALVNCTARNGNADPSEAFFFLQGCTLTDCTATNNTVQHAFYVGSASILQNCVADSTTSGVDSAAAFKLDGAIARGCVANNTSSSLAAGATQGVGFTGGGVYEGCVSSGNAGAGFYVTGTRSVIARCQAIGNGFSGVQVIDASCVIEQNRAIFNGQYGVRVDGTGNVVFANCARGNTAGNYSIVINNRVGAIVVPALNASPVTGNNGGSAFTTDPYANIGF